MATIRVETNEIQWQKTGPNGVKPFILDLMALDVPVPMQPTSMGKRSGKLEGRKQVFTSAGAQQWVPMLQDTPIRLASTGTSHFEKTVVDGEVKKRLANNFGMVKNAYIADGADGHPHVIVSGVYWERQDPVVSQYIRDNMEAFGGSIEISFDEKNIRVDDEYAYMDFVTPTGSAFLTRDVAAMQELTRMLAFETSHRDEVYGLAAEAQVKAFELARTDPQAAEDYVISLRGESEPGNGMGADNERHGSDAKLAEAQATDLDDPKASGSGDPEREVLMDDKLLERLEAQATKITDLESKLQALETTAKQRDDADKASTALFAKYGVESLDELAAKFETDVKTEKEAREALESDLKTEREAKEALECELAEAQAKADFEAVKDGYAEELHERILAVYSKQAKGESVTREELTLLAQGKAVTPPEGPKHQPEGAEVLEHDGQLTPEQIVSQVAAEADEIRAKGGFTKFNPETAWKTGRMQELAGGD